MIDRRDPDWWQHLNDQKARYDSLFRNRKIGEPTYLRSLMLLGYLEKDARTEMELLKT